MPGEATDTDEQIDFQHAQKGPDKPLNAPGYYDHRIRPPGQTAGDTMQPRTMIPPMMTGKMNVVKQ